MFHSDLLVFQELVVVSPETVAIAMKDIDIVVVVVVFCFYRALRRDDGAVESRSCHFPVPSCPVYRRATTS